MSLGWAILDLGLAIFSDILSWMGRYSVVDDIWVLDGATLDLASESCENTLVEIDVRCESLGS